MLLMNGLQSQATISPRKYSIYQEDQRKQQTCGLKRALFIPQKKLLQISFQEMFFLEIGMLVGQ